MNYALTDYVSILSKLLKKLCDYIYSFWDSRNSLISDMNYAIQNRSQGTNNPYHEIDKKSNLQLENILVLTLLEDGINTTYIIMHGLRQDNYDEYVPITNSRIKASYLVNDCIKKNGEIRRETIIDYINSSNGSDLIIETSDGLLITPNEYIEIYNQCLDSDNYELCLKLLLDLNRSINIKNMKCDSISKTKKINRKED